MSYRVTVEQYVTASKYGFDEGPSGYQPVLVQVLDAIDINALLCTLNGIRRATTGGMVTISGPSLDAIAAVKESLRQLEAKAAKAKAVKP